MLNFIESLPYIEFSAAGFMIVYIGTYVIGAAALWTVKRKL